jgi:hypothetical protein
VCNIASCNANWVDLDGLYADGCECQVDANDQAGAGNTCAAAVSLGTLSDAATGSTTTVTGNIAPSSDADWYTFQAQDSQVSGGDHFNVVVKFTTNPGSALQIDVYKGSCAGISNICSATQTAEWATNFRSGNAGENPCSTASNLTCAPPLPDYATCLAANGNNPESCGSCPGFSTPGAGVCVDDSATFYVKVSLATGQTATCAPYTIEISNGVYPYSGLTP